MDAEQTIQEPLAVEAEAIVPQREPETTLAPTSLTPAQMLSLAVQQNADTAKLEKLMDLQERWEKNEARKAYVEAMVKFRAACPTILKTRKVDFTPKDKGRVKYNFAGLPETVEQIQPLMAECQLSATWTTVAQRADWIEIRCDVSHVRGHKESMQLGGPPDDSGGKNRLQMIASTITYLRRTTLFSLLGLVAKDEVDDDGAGGKKKPEPEKPKSAELLDVVAAKRRFGAVCCQKTQQHALPPEVLKELLAQAQRLSGEDWIGKVADWLQAHAEIRQFEGKWTVVPHLQG